MNRINGKKLSEDFFFFYEEEKFDPEKMFKVLAGSPIIRLERFVQVSGWSSTDYISQ